MPSGRRRRKLLLALSLAAAGLALALLSLPLWFPWILRPLAKCEGVHFSTYERLGYSRFALRDVSLTNRSANVQAGRIEMLIPTLWAWRCLRPRDSRSQESLLIANWRFVALPTTQTSGPVYSQFEKLEATLDTLNRWVPGAMLSNGTLELPSVRLDIPVAAGSGHEFRAEVGVPSAAWPPLRLLLSPTTNLISLIPCSVRLRPSSTRSMASGSRNRRAYELQVLSEPLHLESVVTCEANSSGLQVSNTTLVRGSRVEAQGHFARQAMLPDTATLEAKDFQTPTEWVALPGYRPIATSASLRWENGEIGAGLVASATPDLGQTNLPPLRVSIEARGDTNAATVTAATLSAGGVEVELSQELHLQYVDLRLQEPSSFKLTGMLDGQSWLGLRGALGGNVELVPGKGKLPEARFQVSGSEVGWSGLTANTVRIAGSLDWPRLELTKAEAVFADGSAAEVEANLDLGKRAVTAGRFELQGPLARRWLPHGISYRALRLAGTFQGPFSDFAHHGQLEVADLATPGLQPLQFRTEWNGRKGILDFLEVDSFSRSTSLRARGALTLEAAQVTLILTNLTLRTNDHAVLDLTRPFRVVLSGFRQPGAARIQSSPLDCSGPGARLLLEGSLSWPEQGWFRMSAGGLPSSVLTELVKRDLPPIELTKLAAVIGWTNGPAVFDVELAAKGRLPYDLSTEEIIGRRPSAANSDSQRSGSKSSGGATQGQTTQREEAGSPVRPSTGPEFSINLKMLGDQNGVTVSNLAIISDGSKVTSIHGSLPLTLRPDSATLHLRLERQAALEGAASVQPGGAFWESVLVYTGIGFRNPRLELRLAGTWEHPRGEVSLLAEQIHFAHSGTTLPTLEDLRLRLQLEPERARLTEGQLRVQGQPLSLTAVVPLDGMSWPRVQSKAFPDWHKATAHLEMKKVELAAFQPLYPGLLTPQGRLDVDVSLLPGLNLEGTAVLAGARTRPLAQLGPIRDIGATLRFAGQHLDLESATALIGPAPVLLAGHSDLQGLDWLQGKLPPFQLLVRGTNVLLQRQPESIIRADLDLAILKTNQTTPLISGAVHLRDSYYLRDLSALVPGQVAAPERRPPYFSINERVLADWRLALSVDGTRFMRIRGPFFNGEVSTALRIQGTLRDPIALGDAKVDSGFIRLPFANFQVQQGLVTLSSEDPYHPQVLVNASSRQYGYDIRMEVTGPADAPVIQFTSTPPLSSEQILLMVTAGEMPQATFSLTTQQRAQTVALFFGKDLLSKLGLGDQTQARLEVSSGEEISNQGQPTYNVEYKLTDRWSVVGAYDRFGDFNAGFKWLLYSK